MSNRLQRGPGTLAHVDLPPAERMVVFASVNGHAQVAVIPPQPQPRHQPSRQ